jgi:hypothetical protein
VQEVRRPDEEKQAHGEQASTKHQWDSAVLPGLKESHMLTSPHRSFSRKDAKGKDRRENFRAVSWAMGRMRPMRPMGQQDYESGGAVHRSLNRYRPMNALRSLPFASLRDDVIKTTYAA